MKNFLPVIAAGLALVGAAAFAANTPPVNEKCPVCGKDGRLIFHSEVKGERIIFDTAACKDKFDKSPGKYKVIKKAP